MHPGCPRENTRSLTEAEVIRAEIRTLLDRFARGDLVRQRFERAITEKTVNLCRAVVGERLAAGEAIRVEHHFVHAHLAMHRSILQEPEQQSVSLFATDTRLFYLRLRLVFGTPVTCDTRDGTTIDEIPYGSVASLRVRRQARLSEAAAGALIAALAWLFHSWLMITGTLMVALGTLAIVHGLLLPTRWVEIELFVPVPSDAASFTIHALRRKSARRLLQFLKARVPA